ncbi:(2Fe-2S)-binding protein [Foetidibacter luteolus]|uniref:(2Fe-2S)-binding protein n=1 Tax=Foetidibacter luteolus TaxID=2608880 RepID=UPI00129B1CE1|nr:(2Fe-2S)-binding protein [Foetidibacter luteolus]
MPDQLTLHINGKEQEVNALPDTPLLYVLRNNLQLNGPKYGCGIERCGSCMVLLNGKAAPSCRIPCSNAAHFTITTLESLGNAENLHPIQKAFIEHQAAQCGYCMNGMIMCAKALLEENSNPTDTQIRQALQRVLCRCGSHSRIIAAVKSAAAAMKQ